MGKKNGDKASAKTSDKGAEKSAKQASKASAKSASTTSAADLAKPLPKGFSLDAPSLPDDIDDAAMRSGGYPYDKRLKREDFEQQLLRLQIELGKLQTHNLNTKERILVVYEGRDSAGKGTCIKAFNQYLNPRNTRAVALPKPTETERGQLYFQRYVAHLPTSGEIVLFDRSWYNRAGVERVMGFCTEDQLADFLREAPVFEGLLVRDGIRVFKFFLSIGREMQVKRFHERRQNPLKQWKLSDVDLAALDKWDAYTEARDDMFRFTHTASAPWHIVRANDQRRARLETIRAVLLAIDYEGRDLDAIGEPDDKIIGLGPEFLAQTY